MMKHDMAGTLCTCVHVRMHLKGCALAGSCSCRVIVLMSFEVCIKAFEPMFNLKKSDIHNFHTHIPAVWDSSAVRGIAVSQRCTQ